MQQQKLRVAVMFGGRSAEHEVSLMSAINVINALDREKYEPVLIGIDREGRWRLNERSIDLLHSQDPRLIALNNQSREIALAANGTSRALVDLQTKARVGDVDVIFPVLHGPFGEDGSIQGLAKLADLPCVGADILGSAVCMDKDVMKRLLRDAGIPVAPFLVFDDVEKALQAYSEVVAALGTDVFIKPANLGSSVGIAHVTAKEAYGPAVKEAFSYDTKIVVEQRIRGREFEVSVLGNRNPRASVPGEVIPSQDFYSYEAKYIDEHGAALEIPARLDPQAVTALQELAVKAYRALAVKGMARVDFFGCADGSLFVNELNTLPGFTGISMYPKLWEASGIPQRELLDQLIQLALEDFEERRRLRTRP